VKRAENNEKGQLTRGTVKGAGGEVKEKFTMRHEENSTGTVQNSTRKEIQR
jgi:hypothetical protein